MKLLNNLFLGLLLSIGLSTTANAQTLNSYGNYEFGSWRVSGGNGWNWTTGLAWNVGDVVQGRSHEDSPRITVSQSAKSGGVTVWFTNLNLNLSGTGSTRNKAYFIFDGDKSNIIEFDMSASKSGDSIDRDSGFIVSINADSWYTDHPETKKDLANFINRLKSARFVHAKIVDAQGSAVVTKYSLNGSSGALDNLLSRFSDNPFGNVNAGGGSRNTSNPFQG